MIKYRPDIDGLRAVAVLPVVFFHIGYPTFEGGFIGVDIFFVISGFLITSLIVKDIERGRFSILHFYERRIRRLLPALAFIVALTIPFAYWLFLPREFEDFGQSVVACALSVSNILFFKEGGYFDTSADLKPLLHTWSLAVEEQYYLFYPPFLILISRFFKARYIPFMVVVAIASFVSSLFMMEIYQSAAFYFLPFRAWELSIGALLALGAFPQVRRSSYASALGVLGLASIALTIHTYSERTTFPGMSALLPCVGTALVIYSGQTPNSLAARFLSLSPLVFIGKISYSFYLWHWPIIVFTQYYFVEELDLLTQASIVIGSLALSAFSWRYIEQPIHKRRVQLTRRTIFVGANVIIAAGVLAGFFIHLREGMPERLTPEARAFAAATNDFRPRPSDCEYFQTDQWGSTFCLIGAKPAAEPGFLLWGDSHAGVLSFGVGKSAEEAGSSGVFTIEGGCPPLLGVAKDESVADPARDRLCVPHNERVIRFLEANPQIETVIIIARWAYYAKGGGIGADSFNTIEIWPANSAAENGADRSVVFSNALLKTVETLRAMDRRVYLLQQVPEIEDFSVSVVARALRRKSELDLYAISVTSRADVERRQEDFTRATSALKRMAGVTVLETHEHFCDEEFCRSIQENRPLYFDNNHVTVSTARSLSFLFDPAFVAR